MYHYSPGGAYPYYLCNPRAASWVYPYHVSVDIGECWTIQSQTHVSRGEAITTIIWIWCNLFSMQSFLDLHGSVLMKKPDKNDQRSPEYGRLWDTLWEEGEGILTFSWPCFSHENHPYLTVWRLTPHAAAPRILSCYHTGYLQMRTNGKQILSFGSTQHNSCNNLWKKICQQHGRSATR